MRVALTDDGSLFGNDLCKLLTSAGHDVLYASGDGDRLFELVMEKPVDLVLLDIRMPPEPEGGLLTAARLREAQPGTGLLLLSDYAATHYLAKVLEIGNERIGYRLKNGIADVVALERTLLRIDAGEIVIDPELTSRLLHHARTRHGELGLLCSSELRVLRLMADGMSNAGIANEMAIFPEAVERHINSVFTKLSLPEASTRHNRRVMAVLRYLDQSAAEDHAACADRSSDTG